MKKHILLIDNDEDEIEIFTAALDQIPLSYDCMWVQSAEHAIKLLSNFSPDYIFIDYNMPKINGLECLETIKKIDSVKNIPVILYSNNINEENYNKAISLGAYSCLKKPGMIRTLIGKLKEILIL